MEAFHIDTSLPAELSSSPYSAELQVAREAALKAGAVIAAAFRKPKNVSEKSGGATDVVTETDQQAEALILDTIKSAFPSHQFIGEESSAAQGFSSELTSEPTWMVDPLDGTANFVHSFPWVCVSIALAFNKQVVVGVVFNPILQELFIAARGHGAFLNNQRISVSTQTELTKALVCTEVGVARTGDTFDAIFDRIRKVTSFAQALRCTGSCALNLCNVACGRADAFFEINFGGCWDCAAGTLMVEEAGGVVLDPAGGPFGVMDRRVLGANPHLGRTVAELLAGCKLGSTEAPPRAPASKTDA